MAEDDGTVGEPDPQGGSPPEVGPGDDGRPAGARRAVDRALDVPARLTRGVHRRYRGLSSRDRFMALIGLLLVVIVIVVLAIYLTGEGRGPGGAGGTEMVENWKFQQSGTRSNQEENTNLEGQRTIYPVRFEPNVSEVFLVERLIAHVEWTDESTPPTQFPAIGYSNDPDAFQLIIQVQEGLGEWQSEVVYNAEGQSGSIDLEAVLDEPVYVANPDGAEYLPKGYLPSLRIDFIVVTEDCGDWHSSDPLRPTIGDGGNHFTFDWSVEFQYDDDGRP